jgi:hypothetical protein
LIRTIVVVDSERQEPPNRLSQLSATAGALASRQQAETEQAMTERFTLRAPQQALACDQREARLGCGS